jgi:hypothetical protein
MLLDIIVLQNKVGGEGLVIGKLYPQLYLLIQSLNAFLQATKERQGAP